jgi:hypothetical protein
VKRAFATLAAAAMLAAMFPAAVSADRVTRFSDHNVSAGCESPIDGGFVLLFLESSASFGGFGELSIWLDPAIPFEEPASIEGFTDAVDAIEGATEVVLSATLAVSDAEGEEIGDATVVVTLVPVGDPEIIEGDDFGNRNSHTTGTIQPLEGSATITLPDDTEITVPCFGDITDISVHDTNPRGFTASNEGVVIDCGWETEDGFAFFFAVDDTFGFFADAGLFTAGSEIFGTGNSSGTIDGTGVAVTIPLVDPATEDVYSATATAAFTPDGDPVTSVLVSETGHIKLVEQALSADGSVEFSTGEVFTIDDEHCNANAFSSHSSNSQPAGPKPGAAPVNDAPEGAIALELGDRFNVRTGGTAAEAEVPIETCDQGIFDNFGHTLWYTIEGTGGTITIDTAGSNFDTVIAAYVQDGDALIEIACNDDVFLEPIGSSFQGALSGETELGQSYWIQVGGFLPFFGGEAESGRLRLQVT